MGAILSVLVCRLGGTLYPGYKSYKAVSSKNVEEYMRWMKYWTVYAFFTAIEFVLDMVAYWVPLYYEIKILFVLYLMFFPKGSDGVYVGYLQPLLRQHESNVDQKMDDVQSRLWSKVNEVGVEVAKQARKMTADSLLTVGSALGSQALATGADETKDDDDDGVVIPPLPKIVEEGDKKQA
eukprot:m.18170 g.18170  ORF g.18170 m.18170 type:complete len:180 (+) comp11867_c0_seq1:227-766(+)